MTVTDGRRARGDVSRQAVLAVAVDLATVTGLDGLSIGGLASAVSMSKGGIAGLFGSKQELQLATVASAAEIFQRTVIAPALTAPTGLPRLRALIDAWLDYSQNRVFPGGCFFAAVTSEYRSRPGAIRDAVAANLKRWREFLAEAITRAIATGDLADGIDATQLAFEISALLDAANDSSLLFDSAEPYARARAAVDTLLSRAR
ncbi:MAG: TetR/AcrR family transcriptional regulator [Pseudolysinimonas sp.]|uniref:TetR/AcrR family transcriptional regulator n=1 Tax=Pseudolysinimonas sp. TaxID=2680009 RepID=UPI003C741AA4